MTQTQNNIILLVLGGLLAWALFFRGTDTVIKEIRVPVQLTSHQLDSMELAIRTNVLGELKPPVILPPKTKLDSVGLAKRDSIIRKQINEIISLKDSLKGKASLKLEFHGFVGKNEDTLDVAADFISDTISVVFRPKQRNFEVVYSDTTKTGGFFSRIKLGVGVGAAIPDGKVAILPIFGLIYTIN